MGQLDGRRIRVTGAAIGIGPGAVRVFRREGARVAAVHHRTPPPADLLHGVSGGRLGDPVADLGPALVFLASPGAHFITDPLLAIDGGAMDARRVRESRRDSRFARPSVLEPAALRRRALRSRRDDVRARPCA